MLIESDALHKPRFNSAIIKGMLNVKSHLNLCSLKVPANHLLSASVMSAPAALAVAKLFYPETKKSHTTARDAKHMPKG